MKRRGGLVLLFGLIVAFGLGIAWLFRLRVAGGDIYPPYSTLRADALGTRALHDALARLPEVEVARTLKHLRRLPTHPPRTIVLAGITREAWLELRSDDFAALDQAVRAGSRLVLTFAADPEPDGPRDEMQTGTKEEPERKEPKNDREKDYTDFLPKRTDWAKVWGLAVVRGAKVEAADDIAERRASAPGALPRSINWHSDWVFSKMDPAWTPIYERGNATVMIERTFDRGSVVVATDSYFLSNQALLRERQIPLLQWVLGSNARVVFCEAHLGVAEDPGIAALGRRYGLGPAFFTLLLAAALFVWRRTALFVPPPSTSAEVAISYHPTAGLEALLRRAIRPGHLLAACVHEWSKTARPADAARVRAVLAGSQTPPVAAYNAVAEAMKRRRI